MISADTTITSLDDPRVYAYCGIRKGRLQKMVGEGYFLAETFKVIRIALKQGLEFHSIFCTPEWHEQLLAKGVLSPETNFPVLLCEKELMEKIIGFNLHQGLMAIVKRPLDVHPDEFSGPILVFNNVTNPENIGAMVRTAVGLGITNFLLDTSSADPYLRRCVRVSMGNVFYSKVHRTRKLSLVLNNLKERGYQILGSDMEGNTQPLAAHRFPTNFAIIIGSEVDGMQDEILELCDSVLEIPTKKSGYALNASHSAAILCYAAIAQARSDI